MWSILDCQPPASPCADLQCCCAHLLTARTGDSEAVLDRDGEPVVLAEASRHKPDEAHELARIRSKVCDQTVSTLRDSMKGVCSRLLTEPVHESDGASGGDACNAANVDKQSDPRTSGWFRQGGVVNRREQRIISPTGQGALNMSRSLGDKAYKQPHRLVSCEPTVKSIELTCAVGYPSCCLLCRVEPDAPATNATALWISATEVWVMHLSKIVDLAARTCAFLQCSG